MDHHHGGEQEHSNKNAWKKVGFGWATTIKGQEIKRVQLLTEAVPLRVNHIKDFPGEAPVQLIRQVLPDVALDSAVLPMAMAEVLRSYLLGQSHTVQDWADFEAHLGTSNSRSLRWDVMYIPANMSFPLHAHPNIELVLVLQGAIHEYRMMVSFTPIIFNRAGGWEIDCFCCL